MASAPITTTIELTPKEAQLKALLLDVVREIDESKAADQPVVLRWAGGWVRDKLLGIESHDIDTAINSMTGEAFAERIVSAVNRSDFRQKHGITESDVGRYFKVEANPEKSKHLATATVTLLGLDVDFVNLRKETYTEDSRNPQMEFGTAEEDALRRDATINALFYNLSTGLVEDFTGGLADLKAKLIRTPMEPLQTFRDDPLRVLRLIRFASRLEFTIDQEVEQVMGDSRVTDALRIKITRERVGTEIEKMLKGKHPRESLELIDRLGLYHAVFTDPTQSETQMAKPDTSHWRRSYDTLDFLREHQTPGSIYEVLVRSDEDSYYAWILAALAPWQLVEQPPHEGPKKPPSPYVTIAAREGIKATAKLCNIVSASYKHRDEITKLVAVVRFRDREMNDRAIFGMAIKSWGDKWRLQVLSALLVDVLQKSSEPGVADEKMLLKWQMFLDHLQELDVMQPLKPLIDGTQLAKALGIKPGKWMAAALDVCLAWQFRNPDATDPAGAIEEVKSKREELGIPI